MEALDPSVLEDVQDEGTSATLTGSGELLGSEYGCPLALSFLEKAISGVVGDVRIVRLVVAAHVVKANVGGKRALVLHVR